MPAIAEKEVEKKEAIPAKFQQLEKARNYLAEGVAFEESKTDSILFNAPVWALSAKDSLSNILKSMRKNIEEYQEFDAELRKTISKKETAEIREGMAIINPGLKELAEEQKKDTLNKLRKFARQINNHFSDYALVTTQYTVRIGGRYFALLKEIKKASVMLGNQRQREIDALEAEYAEYYHAHDRIQLAILGDAIRPGWLKDLRKKARNAKEIKDYEAFANGFELFILTNKKQMDLLGKHIKIQVEMRFKEAIQLADELLKTAAILESSP